MNNSETKITRSYQQEDIQQILNLAIARQSSSGEFSREQLLEIATELGISTQTIREAEQEWLVKQGDQQQRKEFNLYRRSQLQQRVAKFLIFNSFLVALNFVSAGVLSWSLYILLFWGLGLALNTWNTFQLQGEEYEQAFQRWNRKQQISTSISNLFNSLVKFLS
jgi:hypothetical protein